MSASLNLVLLFASQALAGPLLLPRQDVASSIVASTSFVATSSAAAVAEAEATPVEAAVADTAVVADAAEADVLVASECTLTTFPPATLVYTVTDSVVSTVLPETPGCDCAGGVIAGLYSSINSDGVRYTFCATATGTGTAIFSGDNTAVATSVPTGTPGDAENGAWAQVSCSNNALTNVANNPLDQWEDAGASAAWTDVIDASKAQNLGNLELSNFIFDFFHMRPFPNCEKMDNSNCDVTEDCDQPKTGAGYMIANSMISLHFSLQQFRSALNLANDYVQGNAGVFIETFSPVVDEIKDQQNAKIVGDVIAGLFVVGFAPFFQSFLQTRKFFVDNPHLYGVTGDLTYNLAGTTQALIKDSLPQLSTAAAQNNLTAFLADTTQTWSGATAKIAESWYEDPETLYSIIKDGQVFNLDLSNTPNTDEIAVVLEKSLFAASLPLVWYYNTAGTKPWIATSDGVEGGCADASPVDKIIDDAFEYGVSIPNDELISDVFEGAKICDGDTAYWLLGGNKFIAPFAQASDSDVSLPVQRKDGIEVSTLRGWDSIDGSKWAGLKREDILMNVLNTYKSNGNANKPASLDLSTEEAIAGLYDTDITKAKGLISIPICSFDEASTNAKDGIDENNVNWPCNAP